MRGGGIGTSVYNFNLRKLVLTPSEPGVADNLPGDDNLAAASTGAVAISKSTQSGSLALMNDGALTGSETDFDDEVKGARGGVTPGRRVRGCEQDVHDHLPGSGD